MVESEARRVGIRRVEGAVALLGDVELRSEREPEALERSEPGAQVVLGERLRVRCPLELVERAQLAVQQARADQARVPGVLPRRRRRRRAGNSR